MEGNEKYIDEARQGEALMLAHDENQAVKKKVYIESYGCQMNFSDSEIVASVMKDMGYTTTRELENADVVFLNTCAIRDNAEQKIWHRLRQLKTDKKKNPDLMVGVLGCMAERLKSKLMEEEKLVDIVVGPDAYRDLPNLIHQVESGQKAVNVLLSREETYADISPVRLSSNGVSAFISITRGCDNMCSFCVVPFTRGRERSRNPESVVNEARQLFEQGFREVTLLGQNVDSYLWSGGGAKKDLDEALVTKIMAHELPETEQSNYVTFADLLEQVALINPLLRVRFSTSNPHDMTDAVLHAMARHQNICNYIHLPLQSGNSRILEKMNRGYTREEYMQRIESIRKIIPDCGISTDIISGFCSETDDEHNDTLSLMEWSKYEYAFMFKYSERPGTLAARQFPDDIPEEVKSKRLQEIIALQNRLSLESNKRDVGNIHHVLVEGNSKRSDAFLCGRNDQNKMVVFPKLNFKPGDYVDVLVKECSSATLIGEVII